MEFIKMCQWHNYDIQNHQSQLFLNIDIGVGISPPPPNCIAVSSYTKPNSNVSRFKNVLLKQTNKHSHFCCSEVNLWWGKFPLDYKEGLLFPQII